MGCSIGTTLQLTAYNMKFSLQIMLAIICMSAFIQPSVASAYYDLQYIPEWFRTSEPHPAVEPEPHYEEPAPHYEEPEYHYEKPTSQYCDVLPFTECEMKMYDTEVKVSHWVYKFVPVYKCVKSYEDIVHKKKKPVCSKKPKQVCNSKWKISESGEKVYGGKEDCKTIYVDDCKLKDVPEIIKVEKPHCSITHKAPYMTIEIKKDVKVVYKMECKVLKKNHCEAHTTKDCKHIEYNESQDIPHKKCDPTYIKIPKQHLDHKKKCLFMAHNGLNHETYKLS